MTAPTPSGPNRRADQPRRSARRDDDPVLPDVAADDTDEGWGDEPGARDEGWYRRERPPHHE